ncbi:MAG: hypothetical protein Q8K38_10800 [Burkholderiaceae bacterium]|jgi:hypothetical protein|nr:hypothetical protein [Burkholderiaceae bacterium]MDZ4144708.1 hypothetical protein [Burkholderiales bacterium]
MGAATKEQFNVRVSPALKARRDSYAEMVGVNLSSIPTTCSATA